MAQIIGKKGLQTVFRLSDWDQVKNKMSSIVFKSTHS